MIETIRQFSDERLIDEIKLKEYALEVIEEMGYTKEQIEQLTNELLDFLKILYREKKRRRL